MGGDAATTWGPAPLIDDVAWQLRDHGYEATDASRCVADLAGTRGPAARASLFVDLGGCRLLSGDPAGAEACWRHAAASGQPAPAARALYNLGRFHGELGLTESAGALFAGSAAHEVEPTRSEAELAAAHLMARAGDTDAAIAALVGLTDRLLAGTVDNPVLAEALFGVGACSAAAGMDDRAVQAFDAARSAAPELLMVRTTNPLVRALQATGDHHRAAEIAGERPEDASEFDHDAALERVEALSRGGERDEATVLARQLVALTSGSSGTGHRFRLVGALLDLGCTNEAIDELEDLTGEADLDARARATYLLGELYLAHDRVDVADSMLTAVVRIRSGHWADRAALALGDAAMAAADRELAEVHWTRAVSSASAEVAAAARRRLEDMLVPAPADELAMTIEASVSVPDGEPEASTMIDPLGALVAALPMAVTPLTEEPVWADDHPEPLGSFAERPQVGEGEPTDAPLDQSVRHDPGAFVAALDSEEGPDGTASWAGEVDEAAGLIDATSPEHLEVGLEPEPHARSDREPHSGPSSAESSPPPIVTLDDVRRRRSAPTAEALLADDDESASPADEALTDRPIPPGVQPDAAFDGDGPSDDEVAVPPPEPTIVPLRRRQDEMTDAAPSEAEATRSDPEAAPAAEPEPSREPTVVRLVRGTEPVSPAPAGGSIEQEMRTANAFTRFT